MKRLVLLAAFALLACGDDNDSHNTILPTVPVPPALDATVTCHDWDGMGPDKVFQVAKTERSPRFCYVGGVCFYGCPK